MAFIFFNYSSHFYVPWQSFIVFFKYVYKHTVNVVLACMQAKLLQACLTLCNAIGYRPPGFSVHGILQARIPEWVAMPSSRESS